VSIQRDYIKRYRWAKDNKKMFKTEVEENFYVKIPAGDSVEMEIEIEVVDIRSTFEFLCQSISVIGN
jgi:hypothetical protein